MGGPITAGGLISGIDSKALIAQLVAIEGKPINRLQSQIATLKAQQSAIRSVRTQLTSLRGDLQDFRLNLVFGGYNANSSDTDVLSTSISGSNPAQGSFAINVTQLASATTAASSAKLGGAITPSAVLNSSGIKTAVTAGTFTINGVQLTVDPATQSVNDIITAINGSSAGVTASYNATTDKITLANTVASNTAVINLGANADTSNLLTAFNLNGATQSTNLSGSTELSSTVNLGAVDATKVLNVASFANGAITAGSFSINGVSISIDPTTDTLQDVINRINSSDAHVTASYDGTTDKISFISGTLGSRTISFGSVGDTSNFLSRTNLSSATQTAGNDAQFTVNGGAVQTRNTNEVSDAVNGVTIKLLSQGTSTIAVTQDTDKVIAGIKKFIDDFNASISMVKDITGKDADLDGDSSVRAVSDYLFSNIFSQVSGQPSGYQTLVDIGISTGDDFSATETPQLKFDEAAFRKAFAGGQTNLQNLFSNSNGTGIADTLFTYIDGATNTTGFLNQRAKSNGSIDLQVKNINDSITQKQRQVAQYQARLEKQFLNLEQLSSSFKNQSSALAGARFGAF